MISGQELVEMLQHEVQQWPPQEREIFEMHYLTGLDASEIAMIHSCPSREMEALIGKMQLRFRDFLRATRASEFRSTASSTRFQLSP